jgi:CheY-like chemotaxis protein
VLVVDDDRAVRALVAEILQDEGYEVRQAASGRDALAILRSMPGPCVVLLDHRMPDMTGMEVLAETSGEGSAAYPRAFILLTGSSELVASAANERAAAPDVPVLGKPFELSALIEAVAAAMRRLEASGEDDACAADVAPVARRARGRPAT